jgi:hypothetical protein
MQPSDAGVDVGLLILVDPAGWDPFRQPVGVDAAAPAFLCEVGVVVSAEQGSGCKHCAKRTFAMTSRPGFRLPISRARQAVRTPKFDLFECATHGLAGEDTAGSGYRPRTARMSKSSHVEETASVKGLCGFFRNEGGHHLGESMSHLRGPTAASPP